MNTLNIDEPLVRIAPGALRFYQTDALGSVIAMTDENGIVKTTYTYDPFGNVTISGEASDNPFQYTGREYDGTGLYTGKKGGQPLTKDNIFIYNSSSNSRRNGLEAELWPDHCELNMKGPIITLQPEGMRKGKYISRSLIMKNSKDIWQRLKRSTES